MYAENFGLNQRPVRNSALGNEVFVGPQTAAAISAIKKALAVEDAVITVSGPVGVGKTTVVKRALDAIGQNRIIVSIGRLQLGYDEVIELLLAGLGARQLPKGTVQRFGVFRRLLHQYANRGSRVFIIIEDATILGKEALSELEALTAEDAGASSGASLVLMGAANLAELLREPELARLKQRVRLRQSIQPLDAAELRGYLTHCFRLAGGEFDSLFETGCDASLHRYSGGIPRVANNIIEQAMTTAAETGLKRLSVELIEQTAAGEIGLTAEHSVADIQEALAQAEVEKANAEAAAASELEPEQKQETIEVLAGEPIISAEPKATKIETIQELPASPDYDPASPQLDNKTADDIPKILPLVSDEDVPDPEAGEEGTPAQSAEVDTEAADWMRDTLPDLQVLAPALATAAVPDGDSLASQSTSADEQATAEAVQEPAAEAVQEPAAEAVPEPAVEAEPVHAVEPEAEPAAEAAPHTEPPLAAEAADDRNAEVGSPDENADLPEWERDPTLAQLRPDLDALERAMEAAQGDADEAVIPIEVARIAPPEPLEPALVPEITLDRQIREKIEEATEALRQTETDIMGLVAAEAEKESAGTGLSPTSTPEADQAAFEPRAPAGLAAGEPAAHSAAELEKLAEDYSTSTSLEDMDDKLAETLFGADFSMMAADVAANADQGEPANDDIELVLEPASAQSASSPAQNDTPAPAASVVAEGTPAAPKLTVSATQRLATVRALNESGAPSGAPLAPRTAESVASSEAPKKPLQAAADSAPEPIEEQMNTSMTATLKALNARKMTERDEDEDEEQEQRKGGFFSRFRRS